MIETNEMRRIAETAKEKMLSESGQFTAGKMLIRAADELERLREGQTLPTPLFTRTVYSVDDLHAQIDAIEALGFTNYVIGRDVQTLQFYTNSTTIVEPPTRSRWIIKVYGEVTE